MRNIIKMGTVFLWGLSGLSLAQTQTQMTRSISPDWDGTRGGVKFSSVDIDDTYYDDTIGVGIYSEAPLNKQVHVGVSLDYWQAKQRVTASMGLRDFAIQTYAKYFIPVSWEGARPYGLGGVGVHFMRSERPGQSGESSEKFSLDYGLGMEVPMSRYVGLFAEAKVHNIDLYDYTDVSMGAIARF